MEPTSNQVLNLLRQEFLNTLDKAGIYFTVGAVDGLTNLTPDGVMEYLTGPDEFMAKRAGVAVEKWREWRDFVYHEHSISLADYLAMENEPKRKPDPDHVPLKLRWEVWERDNFTCQRCGTRRELTIDHRLPRSKGGEIVKENLQTLCQRCNNKKGTK